MICWQNHIPRMEKMLNIYKNNNKQNTSYSDDYIWMKLLDELNKTVHKKEKKYVPWEDCYSGGIEWWKD